MVWALACVDRRGKERTRWWHWCPRLGREGRGRAGTAGAWWLGGAGACACRTGAERGGGRRRWVRDGRGCELGSVRTGVRRRATEPVAGGYARAGVDAAGRERRSESTCGPAGG